MRVLGVIPARAGSKGVPGKNTRLLAGEPLVGHAIESAKKSVKLTHLVVTTDDEKVMKIARDRGVEHIERPAELSSDSALMPEVITHTLSHYAEPWDAIMVLQPTCPLRKAKDIDDAILLMHERKAESVVSVYKVEDHHPARMYEKTGDKLSPLFPLESTLNRQELRPIYHRNGLIYLCEAGLLRRERRLWGDRPHALVLPEDRSLNIDSELDFLLAQAIFNRSSS